MNRTQQIRAGVTLVLTLLSLYLLLPTFRAAGISPAERVASANDPALKERIARIDAKAIRRGLDLQGGMYLALEVESEGMTAEQQADALKRVVEIIRNRIDQFGVSEPIIQTQGTGRIIVQLPGLLDPQRAKDLIGRTARLEFRLVRPEEEVAGVLARLDEAFRVTGAGAATSRPAATPAATDSVPGDPFKSLPSLPTADNRSEDDQFVKDHPLTAYVQQDENFARSFGTPMFVQEDEVALVEQLLARPAARAMGASVELQFDSEPVSYGTLQARPLYLLNAAPSLTGDRLTDARTSPDSDRPGGWQVEMTLDRKGARQFSKVTGENVGRNLAITLDGRVSSAPNIRGKIPSGKASITGTFTHEQASDLSLLLRAGALPANIRIEEERTVGPGLGRDSIRQGVGAGLIGAARGRAVHDLLLPVQRDRGGRDPDHQPADHDGDAGAVRPGADAARHRRHRAHGRHGGRRERADQRADPRGAAQEEDRAGRHRRRLRERHADDRRRERHHDHHLGDPALVRHRRDQGLRRDADHRHRHDGVRGAGLQPFHHGSSSRAIRGARR